MFFNGKSGKSGDNMHEINMTPLIDVSLVLVVMLLLATPLAFESSIAVKRAMKSASAAEKQKTEERIELSIISDEEIKINRNRVSKRELSENLRPLLQDNPSRLVVITCRGDVSHGVFVEVLDQAKLCGAAEIAVTEK